jgi:hypothetical protein
MGAAFDTVETGVAVGTARALFRIENLAANLVIGGDTGLNGVECSRHQPLVGCDAHDLPAALARLR